MLLKLWPFNSCTMNTALFLRQFVQRSLDLGHQSAARELGIGSGVG